MEEFFDNYEEENFTGCLSYYSNHSEEFEGLKGDERLRVFTIIARSRLFLRDFIGSLELCRSLYEMIDNISSADFKDEFLQVFILALLHHRDSKGRYIEEYFNEASELLSRVESVEKKDEIGFTLKIMTEQSQGIYNVGDLIFGIDMPHLILVSDYVNSGIEVKNFEGKGRGYCAVKKFEPGDLLIVEKCIFRGSPCSTAEDSLRKLEEDIYYGIQFCPSLRHRLNNLSDGKRTIKEVDNLRSENIRGVINTNAFVELHRPNMVKYYLDFKPFPTSKKRESERLQHEHVCILFERISMLNHSCNPNSNTVFLGDTGFVVAVKPIEIGEEICFDYFSGRSEKWNKERRKTISKHFGIDYVCSCRVCEKGKMEFEKWQKITNEMEGKNTPLLEYYISQRQSEDPIFHPNCIDLILLFASHLFFPSDLNNNVDESKLLSQLKMDFFDQVCGMLGRHGHGLVFGFFQTLHFLKVDMVGFRDCLRKRKEVVWNSVFCKVFGNSSSSRDLFDQWISKL